jgi:MFS family permease
VVSILISLYQLGINIGGLVGTCVNEGTHEMTTRWAYRIPLLIGLVFPVLLVVVVLFLPETPRKSMTMVVNA